MPADASLRHSSLLRCFALASCLFGCGPSFDPPTEIKTLRILGVQKDKPYALPGDDVNLSILWYDGSAAGSADPPRRVQIQWLGGCLNPPADSYEGCFAQYAAAISDPVAALNNGFSTGRGTDFSVHIPTDEEAGSRGPVLHPSQDPKLPLYGLSYVFFSACAGEIVPKPDDSSFPLRCVDANGADLGPDDFVLGYSAIYFFALKSDGTPYLNANPVINSLVFGPNDVKDVTCFDQPDADGGTRGRQDCFGSCNDDGCVNPTEPTDVDCTAEPSLCVPSCKDDGDPKTCPATNLRLDIDPKTFEQDEVTNAAYGDHYGEQMWIDYYATRGDFHSATKLLNDATTGYNSQHGTQYYAPSSPGLVRLWVVVHDNRGGVNWVGTTLKIE
jgi:hypothetical protein